MSRLAEILATGRAPGFNLKQVDPSNVDMAMPRALKEMENKLGTSELIRRMDLPAKKLKKIWDIN